MKIINGSPNLAHKEKMSISPTEIRIGKEDEWPFTIGSMSIILGIMAGIFAPGPWWVYWIIGVLGCVVTVWSLSKKDSRPIYEAKHIMKVQVEGLDRVGTKGTAGTVVGAAVGGIMFGGVGAIVGGGPVCVTGWVWRTLFARLDCCI
jgi:hypothetical protein